MGGTATLATDGFPPGSYPGPGGWQFVDQAIVTELVGRRLIMKRTSLAGVIFILFFLGGFSDASAQVKQVEMHIGGYLCGN